MKTKIEFELPEEEHEYKMAVQARDYYCALFDIYTELHREYKHGREVVKTDRIYERFFEILEDNDVRMP